MYHGIIMTRLFLPYFQKRSKEGRRSLIINVSSQGSFFPLPGETVYGGTKRGFSHFTHSIQNENDDKNIDILLVTPGFVATKMINYA
mmetsp:Transcript_37049/g.27382  ORF Transcript_37049/g.27382 Transcript_37049/m.27382 type:complete len:87 (-) Transcript_37049:236-496(-)